MAEEEVVAPSASAVLSDSKRKFEDLEHQPTEYNANSNPDADNADAAVSDEGENKRQRPRLDDNLAGANANGHQEEQVDKVGVLIGKAGDTIRYLQYNSEKRKEEKMAEEAPRPLNFIPEVILKKRKSNEAFALRKKAQLERRNFQNSKKTNDSIKKPEDLVLEYRNMELDLIRMKRRLKRKLPELNSDSKPLIIIRIQGKKDMHPKTRKVLYNLGLRRIFGAVFVKPSEGVLAKLKRVEPFVTYGYPNLKSIKELIYKKGHARIDKRKVPLTDNNIIEQDLGKHGIVCIEDMVHQIANIGPHFKEVVRFLWPFELNKPGEGLRGSKTLFKDGGDTGNREDLINELISKMN